MRLPISPLFFAETRGPLLDQMIQRVVDGPRLLEDLTDLERNLAGDDGRRGRADAEALRDDVKGRVGVH